jgi:hypothetical protein
MAAVGDDLVFARFIVVFVEAHVVATGVEGFDSGCSLPSGEKSTANPIAEPLPARMNEGLAHVEGGGVAAYDGRGRQIYT